LGYSAGPRPSVPVCYLARQVTPRDPVTLIRERVTLQVRDPSFAPPSLGYCAGPRPTVPCCSVALQVTPRDPVAPEQRGQTYYQKHFSWSALQNTIISYRTSNNWATLLSGVPGAKRSKKTAAFGAMQVVRVADLRPTPTATRVTPAPQPPASRPSKNQPASNVTVGSSSSSGPLRLAPTINYTVRGIRPLPVELSEADRTDMLS
jgi:hypothetical protein